MPVSEKKKASNQRWDKSNMTNIACRVRKEYADKFRSICIAAGTTPNAVLKAAADAFIAEHENKES